MNTNPMEAANRALNNDSGGKNNLEEQNNITPEQIEKLKLGKLESGESVYESEHLSHLHGNVKDDIAEALAKINANGRDFILEQVEMKNKNYTTLCVTTSESDDIFYAQRQNRLGFTRFVKNRDPEPTNTMVVILKKSDQFDESVTRIKDGYTICTAFTGKLAPMEPYDKEIKTIQQQNDADLFWKTHALIYEAGDVPIMEGTSFSVKGIAQMTLSEVESALEDLKKKNLEIAKDTLSPVAALLIARKSELLEQ